ncbi:MAG TPA: PAS domain S-box protein [Steroidobacteraceae bacterium]|jgi:PAS domain S-box-containing protein|nr:PAS domain S-box protein [Steroidobacteraceae bacterium]
MTDESSLATHQTGDTAPPASLAGPGGSEHFARFYTDDRTLIDSVASYVVQGMRAGSAGIVIATARHLASLQDRWRELELDTGTAAAQGRLILLDAVETLSTLMVAGRPDPERFMATVGEIVARASQRYRGIVAFGEMVSLLCAEGNSAAAVGLEALWNELRQRYAFTLFCGYALRDCTADHSDREFAQICAAHTHVIPAEGHAAAASNQGLAAIAQLQRKALALEMRLATDHDTQSSLAHMAAIVESSDDAIVSKTLDGVIRSWNAGAQRLFGYTPEEAIGRAITLIIPPELIDEEQRILAAIRRGERIEHFETTRVAKNHRRIEVSLTVSPVRDASGAIIGASKIARDITERKRTEKLLSEAHVDLQSRIAELARFNAVAVEREGRIVALKRHVNELRAQLGEAAEYSFESIGIENRAPALAYSREPAAAGAVPPADAIAPLESILITEQLHERPSRPPDHAAENHTLAALVQALADAPDTILQVLAERTLDLVGVGSAGLSLLTKDGQHFWWAAIAGEWLPHLGGGTPRDFGPCGDVLDVDTPLLFARWERRYPYLAAATPLAEEGLLVPFHLDGKAVGTLWAMSHDPQRRFDGEDLRLLQSLARFASAAYQTVNMLGAIGERRAALSLLEDAVHARAQAEASLVRLRESEEQLRRSEEALRDANQRKDEFLALLAHELRNPLAPIRYAVAANRKADRTPEQRRWADEIMERQVAHMSRLLDDLLDVSRITRGTLELKKAPAELTSVLSAAIETARPLLDSKHHDLSLDFPREAMRLDADAVRLAQVFSNLLINAAKYTEPRGKIHLSACRDGAQIVVSVRDNGIGIAAETMPRLFTMFAQAEGVRDRTEGGLGVGLALVRGIVALHGGTVHAHSTGLGHGSEFVVRLPLGEIVDASIPASVQNDKAGAGLRILIADDNQDAADTCAALLELSGHRVETAYSAHQALELAEKLRPHAALLDIGLPDLNGYALAQRIRESSWGQRTLLIAVTGWGQSEDRRRAYEAGFDHHLSKPVAAEAIESALRMLGSSMAAGAGSE